MTTITVWRTPDSPAVFVNAQAAMPGHITTVAHALRKLADLRIEGYAFEGLGLHLSAEPATVEMNGATLPDGSQVLVFTFDDAGDITDVAMPGAPVGLVTLLDAAGFLAAQAGFHYGSVIQSQAQEQVQHAALVRELTAGRRLS